MLKLDLKKDLKHLYQPTAKQVTLVEVPAFNFAMVDGVVPAGISPGDAEEYLQSLQALYGISYTLKFRSKLRKENPVDYPVMALEGLWWNEAEVFDFDSIKTMPMYFTSMIMQPDHLTEADYLAALEELRRKRPNPALDKMRFERFQEGLCIQIMHIGPYSEEPRTLEKMDAFAAEHGYRFRGRHHEIYLGDPRRAKPEKLKTVLRHAVEKA
jgi:hypothetical protein